MISEFTRVPGVKMPMGIRASAYWLVAPRVNELNDTYYAVLRRVFFVGCRVFCDLLQQQS